MASSRLRSMVARVPSRSIATSSAIGELHWREYQATRKRILSEKKAAKAGEDEDETGVREDENENESHETILAEDTPHEEPTDQKENGVSADDDNTFIESLERTLDNELNEAPWEAPSGQDENVISAKDWHNPLPQPDPLRVSAEKKWHPGTPKSQVFVIPVPFRMDARGLKHALAAYPGIKAITILRRKAYTSLAAFRTRRVKDTGIIVSRGLAIVDFESVAAATRCVEGATANPIEGDPGYPLRMKFWWGAAKERKIRNGYLDVQDPTRIGARLAFEGYTGTKRELFFDVLGEYGRGVVYVSLAKPPKKGKNPGTGYVDYESIELAQEALDALKSSDSLKIDFA